MLKKRDFTQDVQLSPWRPPHLPKRLCISPSSLPVLLRTWMSHFSLLNFVAFIVSPVLQCGNVIAPVFHLGKPPCKRLLGLLQQSHLGKSVTAKKCLHFENLVHAADHPVVEDLDVLTLIIRGVRVRVRGLVSLTVHWDHLPKKDKAWNTWFT